MGEPLKDIYTLEFLSGFGEKVRAVQDGFDVERFTAAVMARPWETLPLKARMGRIAETLGQFLPDDYNRALEVLFAIDESCTGFPYLFFPEFVVIYGRAKEHWDLSMTALERFTQRSSSEFAIRPFLVREPQRVMERMMHWTKHPNEHVRRFSSEGCRPRLPWGIALPMFKRDPSLVLALLEHLKADPSLYVRKSVANNLNDIAKDNPGAVLSTARRWIGKDPDTDWILRQGCRTLIRKADPEAMEMFGYAGVSEDKRLFEDAVLSVQPAELKIGESCKLEYTLDLSGNDPVHIRLEYGIDFVKYSGKQSRKLFLLTDKTIPGGTRLTGKRIHSFADLTTRRHYPGVHRIVLLINGQEAAQTTLNVTGG